MINREVLVYMSLGEKTISVGKLWFYSRKGRESASFEYDSKWLHHPEKFALDPALTLTKGIFHTSSGKSLFGAIGDSAPDRWGRALMRRYEAKRIKNGKESPKTLSEIDYLLGVNDEARQGALRFSLMPDHSTFLAQKNEKAIPPLIKLPALLSASEHFFDHAESVEDLRLLLTPGSSLGGARPKASIYDYDGSLSIAKFPRQDDEFNTVLWEAVSLTLARNSGINVSPFRLERVLGKPVLIIKRFDRNHQQRIPFLSAMSMIGAQDNEDHSYLEIAYALIQNGADPKKDLFELWQRIVFTILISNTDDHLRNHGFIYEPYKGWRLSPAYDLNPTPTEIKPRILTTAINFEETSASLDTALEISRDFRLSEKEVHEIVKKTVEAVKNWRKIASDFKIRKNEIECMASAFEHDDFRKAESF